MVKKKKQSEQKKRIRRFRISILAIFVVTFLVFVVLRSVRVGSTQVDIQLTASEISFEISESWSIYSLETESIKLSNPNALTIEALSVEQLAGYDPVTDEPREWQEIESEDQLLVRPEEQNWAAAIESNYLNLTSLDIASGSLVTISRAGQGKNQINMRISDGAVHGSINTGDTLIFTCSGCLILAGLREDEEATKSLRIVSFDNEIEFRDMKESIQIEADIPKQAPVSEPLGLGSEVFIQTIEFRRFRGDHLESTIVQGGSAYFSELGEKKLEIDDGDFVILDDLNRFQIKNLQLNDHLMVSLQGRAGTLMTGSGASFQSRMPSWLDRLYSNPTIGLLATLVPVFLTILTILDRLGILKNMFEREKS